MKEADVVAFLNFRRKFSKREWNELNRAVEAREMEKADKIELDDLDLEIILSKLNVLSEL